MSVERRVWSARLAFRFHRASAAECLPKANCRNTFSIAGQPDLVHIGMLHLKAFNSGKGKLMRHLLFCLACLPAVSMAQTNPDGFSQEKFEKRFHAADKNGDGMLSREEAYAAFPRAPQFFDEIDLNNDNHITLVEVSQARARRVEAAISVSGIDGGAKYVKPEYLKSQRASGSGNAVGLFPGMEDAQRDDFYESLAGDQDNAPNPGIPAPAEIVPNLLNKSF